VTGPLALLVMAYGTASGPDDVERYYTDIRGGRPPSRDHLEELRERYAAIGNRFPLLDITTAQADGLAEALVDAGVGDVRPYLGMKHSPPFVPDAVDRMRRDGIERAVGIVMAPHWSGMSVETYIERVEQALAVDTGGDAGRPAVTFVREWFDHPAFLEFLADRVRTALERLPADAGGATRVLFSAHSLPVRSADDGSPRCLRCRADRCRAACTYAAELRLTADLVARRLGLDTFGIAWQSAGRTDEPWWGPPVEDEIRRAAKAGFRAVVVCSAGFVSDHLEILYDLDIEARAVAEDAGLAFARTEMPNADPAFLAALVEVVRAHLSEG
jgi:protoporphyrin/coproporphyrin ferrochelatase